MTNKINTGMILVYYLIILNLDFESILYKYRNV